MNVTEIRKAIKNNQELYSFIEEYFENFKIERYSAYSYPFYCFAKGDFKNNKTTKTLVNFRKDLTLEEVVFQTKKQLFTIVIANKILEVLSTELGEKNFSISIQEEEITNLFRLNWEEENKQFIYSFSLDFNFNKNNDFSFYLDFSISQLQIFLKTIKKIKT